MDSDLFHLTVRCTSLLNTVPLPWKLASLIPVTFVTKHSGPKVTLWGCCFVVDAVSFHPYNKLKPFYYYIYYLLGAGGGACTQGTCGDQRTAWGNQFSPSATLTQAVRLGSECFHGLSHLTGLFMSWRQFFYVTHGWLGMLTPVPPPKS